MKTTVPTLALLFLWFLPVDAKPPELPKEVTVNLASNPEITLYSLQPDGGPDIPEWDFHGHHILGHVDLSPEQTKVAITALKDAVSSGNADMGSLCIFNPRHALRFKTASDTYDILICYECGQLGIYKNDRVLPFNGMIGGKPEVLNQLLKMAHVTLADTRAALSDSCVEEAKLALQMAQQGDAKAKNVIARMFLSGRGVKKDEAEGIKWLAKSMGFLPDSPVFQLELGRMYEHGQDVAKSNATAMNFYQKAAAQGSVDALYRMGSLYENGLGVAKNPEKALELYRKAAEGGSALGELTIGVRYANGWDVKQDYSEALKWFRQAADQAEPLALAWLAKFYENGSGVPKNQEEAYFWERLASSYGAGNVPRTSISLTSKKRAALDRRLADWTAKHPKRAVGWDLP